jgi:hypothetical protein
MSTSYRLTADESVFLGVLVQHRPAFSFELVKLLRSWGREEVAKLLAQMQASGLVDCNSRGAYFPSKAGCDAVRTAVKRGSEREPSATRWRHFVPRAAAWDWLGGEYDALAERARAESPAAS